MTYPGLKLRCYKWWKLLLVFGLAWSHASASPINNQDYFKGLKLPVEIHINAGGGVNETLRNLTSSGSDYSWQLITVEKDQKGDEHSRYQQFFKGVKVKDAIMIIHQKPGEAAYATGSFMQVSEYNSGNVLSGEELLRISSVNTALKNTHPLPNSPELYWVKDEATGLFIQTYFIEFFPQHRLEQHLLQVNAHTGEAVSIHNHSCYINSPGIAHTAYHGSCNITSFHEQGKFVLKSTNRGQGIETRNLNHQLNYNSITEFTDDDNTWSQQVPQNEKYAADAHYCAEQYYDFLQNDFGRNSIDNNGQRLLSYLNYGNSLLNAFWNGSAVVYGSGNASSGPLTTLDISGHEFTHGLIQKTANLNYQGEPGTINEALADIFGTALEFFAAPQQADWQIGERTGNVLRSLENPKLYNQPDTYHGTHWYFGIGDNGGIHINSGFINKWFHLLSEGGTGVNDKGWNYSVQGIGMEKAINTVYHSLTAYLLPSSRFDDLMIYSLQSTIDLYGNCSPEYLSAMEAWKAVGMRDLMNETLVLTGANGTTFCEGDTFMLSTDPIPGFNYTWYRDSQVIYQGNSSLFPVTSNGTYSVAGMGCGISVLSNTILLQAYPLPIVSAVDYHVCEGESVQLQGFPAGGIFSVPNPYTGPSTEFIYRYSDMNGCTSEAVGKILIESIPQVNITNEIMNHPVNSTPIQLTGNVDATFYGFGVENGVFYPEITGIGGPYTVYMKLTNSIGCSSTDSVQFHVEKPCIREVGNLGIQTDWSLVDGKNTLTVSLPISISDFEIHWNVKGAHQFLSGINGSSASFIVFDNEVMIEVELVNSCNESMLIQKNITVPSPTISDLNLYPNPIKESLNIDFGSDGSSGTLDLELLDVTGKVVKQSTFTGLPPFTWNMEGVSKGIYLLRIQRNNKIQILKLVMD